MLKTNEMSVSTQKILIVTIIAFIIMAFLGTFITASLMIAGDIDLVNIAPDTFDLSQRNWFRLGLLANNLLMFGGTALLAFFYLYRANWVSAAGLDQGPTSGSLGYASGFFLLALPLVAYLAYLNLQVDLPDWAVQNEEQTNKMLQGVLTMESVPEFLLALLTAAVTPAIAEELLLRGLVQKRLLGGWLKNHHAAIWLAATIFSTMHFEFGGFLPRLALGVTLGYAYHWTSSLWVPIILHFLFNGLQVAVAYFTGEFTPDTEMADVPPWWMALISFLIISFLWVKAEKSQLGAAAGASIA
ncbi:MAG: CPBP family intramembrane glutamic endopeptidase [Bacteroidota bacterium]